MINNVKIISAISSVGLNYVFPRVGKLLPLATYLPHQNKSTTIDLIDGLVLGYLIWNIPAIELSNAVRLRDIKKMVDATATAIPIISTGLLLCWPSSTKDEEEVNPPSASHRLQQAFIRSCQALIAVGYLYHHPWSFAIGSSVGLLSISYPIFTRRQCDQFREKMSEYISLAFKVLKSGLDQEEEESLEKLDNDFSISNLISFAISTAIRGGLAPQMRHGHFLWNMVNLAAVSYLAIGDLRNSTKLTPIESFRSGFTAIRAIVSLS